MSTVIIDDEGNEVTILEEPQDSITISEQTPATVVITEYGAQLLVDANTIQGVAVTSEPSTVVVVEPETETVIINAGVPGPGVPDGGDAGSVLVKETGDDHDTAWKKIIYYGTGAPPSAEGIQDGALYIQHEV